MKIHLSWLLAAGAILAGCASSGTPATPASPAQERTAAQKDEGIGDVKVIAYPFEGDPHLAARAREILIARLHSGESYRGRTSLIAAPSFPPQGSPGAGVTMAQSGYSFALNGKVKSGDQGYVILEAHRLPEGSMNWMALQPMANEGEMDDAVAATVDRFWQRVKPGHLTLALVSRDGKQVSLPADHPQGAAAPAVKASTPPTPAKAAAASPAPAPEAKPTPDRGAVKASALVTLAPMEEVAKEGFTIQVGAYQMDKYADEKMAELKKRGYSPYKVDLVDSAGRHLKAVRFGQYPDNESARDAMNAFRAKEGLPAYVAPTGAF